MLSSAQLVELSCQICKAPGYKTQAGQLLNLVLADLAQIYDFDFERVPYDLAVTGTSPSYSLPANHLRTRQAWYLINGAPLELTQIPYEQYVLLMQTPAPNISNIFAVDVSSSPRQIYFYPSFSAQQTVKLLYQPQPADIVTPETNTAAPWFPNQRLLLKQLNAELSQIVEDNRENNFQQKADENLRKFLVMDDDKGNYAQTVQLDRRQFRSRVTRPSKLFPLGG